MDDKQTEHIVMTPKCKTAKSTTLVIERQAITSSIDKSNQQDAYVAGGDHKGIVINKHANAVANGLSDNTPAHLCLEFRVFLVSAQTKKHTQESRTLKFWFVNSLPETEHASVAQEFFKELVSPQEFPRDYVGFIKKIMKLMQHKYVGIKKLEVELKQLEEPITLPSRPLSADETIMGQIVELTSEKVLELIESAYPNPVTIADMAKEYNWDVDAVNTIMIELQKKGVVKAMEHGAFTRVAHQDTQIKVVKQMPAMANAKQPTIAIITAQYCEKLAVDSMIENKETFVRYTTVGESNVYTLGNIGDHRIVCTKLPTVGHTREAITAAGNTTTRLLGTFQKVDYVFLVGVGGGVPHYTDYNKHVRLGDVVVSYPTMTNKKYVYIYCENAKADENGSYHFDTKEYCPVNLGLQELAMNLKKNADEKSDTPWKTYLKEGLENLDNLQSEHDFKQPPLESDKLYMAIGERDVIEVAHPAAPQDISNKRMMGCPRIHLASIASGRQISRDDQLRQKFASRFGCLAFDGEMDAVVESILGNCRESFAVVRGISDYKDGSRGKEWQPYAALAAASVVKSIIYAMDPPSV
ncbi:uncharacterized protein [Chelonus insularis]|uniref:uncharacterized protein isoform X2 n=1 Tax=Chelonus insularis TaxID=460826 RepID=UPI001589BEF5|nr:uncharacterized protein LOC118068960 isoform X2 [Chelonus insularis]